MTMEIENVTVCFTKLRSQKKAKTLIFNSKP